MIAQRQDVNKNEEKRVRGCEHGVHGLHCEHGVHVVHGVHGVNRVLVVHGLHCVHGVIGLQYLVYKGKIEHKEKHVCMTPCTWFTTLRSKFM